MNAENIFDIKNRWFMGHTLPEPEPEPELYKEIYVLPFHTPEAIEKTIMIKGAVLICWRYSHEEEEGNMIKAVYKNNEDDKFFFIWWKQNKHREYLFYTDFRKAEGSPCDGFGLLTKGNVKQLLSDEHRRYFTAQGGKIFPDIKDANKKRRKQHE